MIFRSRKRRARENDNANSENTDGEDTGDRSGHDGVEDHDLDSGLETSSEQVAAQDDAQHAAGPHGAEDASDDGIDEIGVDGTDADETETDETGADGTHTDETETDKTETDETDAADTDSTDATEKTDVIDPQVGAAETDSGDELGDLSDAEMAEMDAQDWRELGPYDIGEVDAEALEEAAGAGDQVDLGSMVLPSLHEVELRLQVDEESQQIVSAMMVLADSALEVGAFAAPRSGGLWPEIRPELISSVTDNGGSANLVEGPYGVELRRLIPVQTPDGEEGYQPSRMWIAEGPRWMLRGIAYGEAALTDGTESPVAELLDLFRQVVVRRGDEAMAPGDLLPLAVPEALAGSEAAADDAEDEDTDDGVGEDGASTSVPGHGPSRTSDNA